MHVTINELITTNSLSLNNVFDVEYVHSSSY